MELFELGDNLPNLMSSFAELSFLKKDYLYIEITLLRMKLNIHSIHLYFILEFQLIRTRGICAQHLDISKMVTKIDKKCPKGLFFGGLKRDQINGSTIFP